MAITKGSDFKSLLTDASTFLNSLSSVSRNYNESVSSAKSILSTLDFSTWSDNVGQKVNTYVSSLSTGVDAIYNDINSGAFVSLATLVSYLCNALTYCINYKNAIATIDETINNNTFNTDNMAEYNALIVQRRGYDSQLDAAVQDCNNILTSINQVLFNSGVEIPEATQTEEIPQIEYSPLDAGSDSGTGDTGEGTEETPSGFVDGDLAKFTEDDMYNRNGPGEKHAGQINLNKGKSYYVQVGTIDGNTVDAILTFNGNSRSPTDWGCWSISTPSGEWIGGNNVDYDPKTGLPKIRIYQTPSSDYGNANPERYSELFGNQ